MNAQVLANAKAYVSLVALIATALLGSFATDSTAGKILTGIVAVGGAFATWATPNTPKDRDEAGEANALLIIAVAALVLAALAIVGYRI